MTKNVIVMFSGGIDSTYLLLETLSQGHNVFPVFAKLENNYGQVKRETKSRDSLVEVIRKRMEAGGTFCGKPLSGHLNPLFQAMTITQGAHAGFQQPSMWLLAARMAVCGISVTNAIIDEVRVGYVVHDDALAFLDELRIIWNQYNRFPVNPTVYRITPKLVFPLRQRWKLDLWVNLPDWVKPHLSVCEDARTDYGAFCGLCHSCTATLQELTDLRDFGLCERNRRLLYRLFGRSKEYKPVTSDTGADPCKEDLDLPDE